MSSSKPRLSSFSIQIGARAKPTELIPFAFLTLILITCGERQRRVDEAY